MLFNKKDCLWVSLLADLIVAVVFQFYYKELSQEWSGTLFLPAWNEKYQEIRDPGSNISTSWV